MIILAGDIGGTNSRLAILETPHVSSDTLHTFALQHVHHFSNSEFSGIEEIIQSYIADTGKQPELACLAVAGPVPPANNSAQTMLMTNLDWTLATDSIQEQCNIPRVVLINDYTGLPYVSGSNQWLKSNELQQLQTGSNQTGSRQVEAWFGAGTGLGCVIAMQQEHATNVMPTEAGHTDISGSDNNLRELASFLQKQQCPVCWESVLSGNGLVNLHQFLQQHSTQQLSESESSQALTAAQITQMASNDQASCEYQTVALFTRLAGEFAHNLVLNTLATKVFLVGNIFSIAFEITGDTDFLQGFYNTKQHPDLLQNCSLMLVRDKQIGLKGAAAYALKQAI